MLPGMGGRMDPRRMNAMMRQLGIDVKDIPNVTEVVIRTPTRDYLFSKADVTVMTAQGQKTYQVVGNPVVKEKAGGGAVAPGPAAPAAPVKLEIPADDIELVADQSGATKEKARAALEATGGDIAEAIVRLKGT